jgi:hypothetical protein
MTNKVKASLRAISEQYVKDQLRHVADDSISKVDVERATKKVNDVLVELEKAKARYRPRA